jgi:hypothetical protein
MSHDTYVPCAAKPDFRMKTVFWMAHIQNVSAQNVSSTKRLHTKRLRNIYGNSRKKKSASFTVYTQVLLLAKIYEAHYLMLTARPNLTTKENKLKKISKIVNEVLIIFKNI